ncbi:GNAT family N-acetyltransferase [Myceligenerans xiligouense]
MVLPEPTARLRFREMSDDDLDHMAALLGDPEVMRFYPAPKNRAQAQSWIDWNVQNYALHGFGLWVVETHDGEFVGDCGLTWQTVGGERHVEVGYHVRAELQGRGFATEAAAACRDAARAGGIGHLVAIIHPRNVPSQRVAQKLGLTLERSVPHGEGEALIFSADLDRATRS